MTKLMGNRFFRQCISILFCVLILPTFTFGAEELSTQLKEDTLPGVSLAQGISQMTGAAISPLLGVSAIGAWRYFQTDKTQRHLLPWFCKPMFWGIGLSVLALIFLKDSIGVGLPPYVKKPLDLLELFEGKFSAAIATTAFVPFVAKQMSLHFSGLESQTLVGGNSGELLASIPVAFSMHWFLMPICIVGFLMVWIVSHAINVLILLSPFGLIDAFLKSCRIILLSSIAVLYAIHPVLAAIVSVVVIVIAAFLAPSAFRLSVFGTVMSTDYLLSIFRRKRPIEKVYGFLAKQGSQGLKARTFGWVTRDDASGRLMFLSKFLFFGPTRKLALPESESIAITRGLIFPSISVSDPKSGKSKLIVNLLPQFRIHVEETARHLEISQILDSSITRGVKAMWGWLKETLQSGRDRLVDLTSEVAGKSQKQSLPPPPQVS